MRDRTKGFDFDDCTFLNVLAPREILPSTNEQPCGLLSDWTNTLWVSCERVSIFTMGSSKEKHYESFKGRLEVCQKAQVYKAFAFRGGRCEF